MATESRGWAYVYVCDDMGGGGWCGAGGGGGVGLGLWGGGGCQASTKLVPT
jgi:hypothetical protein